MRKYLFTFVLLSVVALEMRAGHTIYLIHGYGGFSLEMQKIKRSLETDGYRTEFFSYPSMREDIDSAAYHLYLKILADNSDSISFVTHSMGALVARSVFRYLPRNINAPFVFRIVMIAPPNKGTPVADFFVQSRIARFLGGPNLSNLTTDPLGGANSYPVPDIETGIILGIRGDKKGYNIFLEDDNDGMIIPKHALLGNEQDLAFVKATHAGILYKQETIRLILHFLKKGKFPLKKI